MNSSARVQTVSASRYMQQLAKHWSHKMPVEFDDSQAKMTLPIGGVTMHAGAEALDVRIEAADAEALERLKGVVSSHVDRFAHREAPLSFDWQDAA